jgi:hypothetical protein
MNITYTNETDLPYHELSKFIGHANKMFSQLYHYIIKKQNGIAIAYKTLLSLTLKKTNLLLPIERSINSAKVFQNQIYSKKNTQASELSVCLSESESKIRKYNEVVKIKENLTQQVQTLQSLRKTNSHGVDIIAINKAKAEIKFPILSDALVNLISILNFDEISSIENIAKFLATSLIESIKNYECKCNRAQLTKIKIDNDSCIEASSSIKDTKGLALKPVIDTFIKCASNLIGESLMQFDIKDNVMLLGNVIILQDSYRYRNFTIRCIS